MKALRKVSILFSLLVLVAVPLIVISGVPPKPSSPRLVNDLAGLLTPDEAARLEQKLVAYNDSTSTQITVVTLKSLDGYDIDDLAQRIGQTWGAGQKSYDNGIIILIKPKIGNEAGKAAISTGYGMEEIIPDAIARRIVDNEMIPFFKKDSYYGGINAGTDVIMGLASGKFKAKDYGRKGGKLNLLLPLIVVIGIILLFGRNKGGKNHNIGSSNLPFWLLLSMMGSGGRGSGGDWGGFSGGGGGGGGFGGFGGGGFGGGGASGSW